MLDPFRLRLEKLYAMYTARLIQENERGHYAEAARVQAKLEMLNEIIEEIQTLQLTREYHEHIKKAV